MSEFICTICKSPVSKRQSLAVAGGRACRSHSEAQQESQKRIDADDEKRKAIMAKIEAKRHRRDERWTVPTGTSCWCCHKEGITARDHFLKMMLANEVVTLQGKSILDSEAFASAYGERQPVMVFLKVSEHHPIVKYSRDGVILHQMSDGMMFVCHECASKYGLEKLYKDALCPPIYEKTLTTMMAIVDTLPITKAVKEVAQLQVAGVPVAVNEVQS